MLKTVRKHLALGAVAIAAAGLASAATADYRGHQAPDVYWKGGGWIVDQYYTETKGWCAAHVDYHGGERLTLIGTKNDWTLRLSHAGWSGLEAGRRYDIHLRTEGGWSVDYDAWGYRAAKGGRGGFTMPTFPRALDALSHSLVVYFDDRSGATIAALDLSGSARAIAALRNCRTDLVRSGGFAGRGPSPQTVSQNLSSGPDISPIVLTAAPATEDAPSDRIVASGGAEEAAVVDVTPFDAQATETAADGIEVTRLDDIPVQEGEVRTLDDDEPAGPELPADEAARPAQ